MPAPRRPQQPQSLVQHLADQARRKPVNSTLSLSRYYMSADLLLRQADSYRIEGNEEQQYVILMRFASLVLETIPDHKDFAKSDAKYTKFKRVLAEQSLPELERLKLCLRTKDIVDPHAHSRNRPSDAIMLATSNLPGVNWSGDPTAQPRYDPSQVKVDDLLDIIQHGAGPSTTANYPTAQAPPTSTSAPPNFQLAPTSQSGGGYGHAQQQQQQQPPAYQPKYTASVTRGDNRHDLFLQSSSSMGRSSSTNAEGGYGSRGYTSQGSFGSNSNGGSSSSALPRYPALQQLTLSSDQQQQQQQQLRQLYQPPPTAGPSLGPQEIGVINVPQDLAGRPATCTGHAHAGVLPPYPPSSTTTSAAMATSSALYPQQPSGPPSLPTPPSMDANAGSAAATGSTPGGPKELVKRAALRDVHVSVALMEEFLAYARANTQRNIESCGILAGRLSANDSSFTITTLIIPKQQGTTDTVQALNEEEIFEVQFSQELYPLGWIHTHPSQTCFLSSVDVHTQCGYQTMLDEAVAIVMAPTDRSKKCGIFRLSTPGGLTLVQKCNLRGFHMHPDTHTGQELYELCGHVYLNPRAKHHVIDLR